MVSLDTESNLSHHDHAVRARQGPIIMRCKGGILMAKNNKPYEADVEKIKKSLGYRASKKLLSISIPVLYALAIAFAFLRGYSSKLNAAAYAGLSETMDGFMRALLIASTLNTLGLYGINSFAKAAKLNSINKGYLEYFKMALKSKISDIQKLSPERIHGLVQGIAAMKADIKSCIIDIVQSAIPFAIVVYEIAKMNLLSAMIMVVIMTIVILGNLYSDKLFHFDSDKSKLKANMQGFTTSLYMCIPMLKYMNAETWAYAKMKESQDEATPALQNCSKQFYCILLNALSLVPELICMWNAIRTNDAVFALYLGFNIYSVYNMMYVLRALAESKSELDGDLNTAAVLKGDDKPYEEKPAFPEKFHLQNIRFYYESDEEMKKPFIFEDLTLMKGKKYRFVGPSGSGKSTAFRYFAGEMVSDTQPDFRTFYIHQQAKLLDHGTLRDNITLGNKWVPDGDIISLLEDMGMGQWVRNLPKGLDSIVGEDVSPSGGESSRISLMRAFIHVRNYTEDVLNRQRNTSDLILMDEVTSALDKRTRWLKDGELCTEEKVIKLCQREFAGCTVAIISHEDETSKALGFRDIVDFEVQLHVQQNGELEEHIFSEAIPTNNKSYNITPLTQFKVSVK